MVDGGIPLWRVAVFVNTLHPDVMGRAFIWQVDTGVKVSAAPTTSMETDEYRNSPVVAVYATRQPMRRRLADGVCPDDFPVLNELRAEGATDYVAFPLLFTDGTVHVATWTTRQPGGFTPEHSPISNRSRAADARRRNPRAAADRGQPAQHLCRPPGRRAHPRRKDPARLREAIHAAIWLSDMRGFTALSERLPPQA